MKTISPKILVSVILIALVAGLIIYRISGLYGMFQPHTYNWKTGMPSLENQIITFQQTNKRWPKNYDDLVIFMKQTTTNFIPESYDRIDFIAKPDGNLDVDVFNAGLTNHIALNAARKE